MERRKHIPALDGLRGCAVLAVLFLHLGGGAKSHNPVVHAFGFITRFGWIGVTLFFVLSGFLITGILWDSRGAEHWWRNFFMRRSLRIFPLYYAVLVGLLVVMTLRGLGAASLAPLGVYALYLQNIWYGPILHGPALPIQHFWSLAVEEQFYLIWPWLLVRLRTIRQGQILCLMVIAASLIFDVGVTFLGFPSNDASLLANVGALGFGGLLSLSLRSGAWPRLERFAPLTLLAGLGGYLWTVHLGGEPPFHAGLPFLWLMFGSLLVLALRRGWVSRVLSMRWLCWVGSISYGLYVFHLLLVPVTHWLVDRVVIQEAREARLGIEFLLSLGLSFAAASLSYYGFERPILRLKRRFPEGSGSKSKRTAHDMPELAPAVRQP